MSDTVEERHLHETLRTLPPTARSRSVSGWTPLFETIRVLPDLATHEVPASVIPHLAPSSLAPCLPAAAGVAVHSIALATPVSLRGCWDGVGLPLRAPSPGYAVREERACQRTCSCEIWILERSTTSMGVWKLWQTDCRCLAGLTTLVSALRRDGTTTRGAANRNCAGHSGSTQTEGERSCQVGHTCRRSWWPVVD